SQTEPYSSYPKFPPNLPITLNNSNRHPHAPNQPTIRHKDSPCTDKTVAEPPFSEKKTRGPTPWLLHCE
ncbi:6165_t:CDS:2, partial [Racocetra fulgida]